MTAPTKRRVFFSFHYDADVWRAGQVRNLGVVDDSSPFSDNDWEEVRRKSNAAIENWIERQLKYRKCLVVLIGETTYTRRWVLYEIQRAYEMGKGLLGVRIHKLKNRDGRQSRPGWNPFELVESCLGIPLSEYVKILDSQYYDSSDVYNDIKAKLPFLIEQAIGEVGTY